MSEWLKEAVLKTAELKGSVGSNPTLRVIFRGVAQLVERLVWDQDAAGSNPVTPITFYIHKVKL